jgi:cellulose biosynthesis protein BcsQ
MSVSQFIEALKDFARDYYPLVALVTTVIGFTLGLRTGFWTRVLRKIVDFWRTDVRTLKAERAALAEKLQRVHDAFEDDNNIWLRQPVIKPDRYNSSLQSSIPILLIANLKGGVGKTTIAANLATYFERRKGERVLAIDLDHQGSLSSMLLPEDAQRTERPADVIKSLIGGATGMGISSFAQRIPILHSRKDSLLIECDDAFGNYEMRLLLEWLIGERPGDIRYNLARILHSPDIQQNFNRIIIDAPPRMTPGLVNALCASTHLVVPFVLDVLSAERVGLFLRTVKKMRGELFPHLELAAVVGTLKGDGTERLRDTEEKALREAERGVSETWGNGAYYVWRDVLIPRRQPISDAAGIGVNLAAGVIFEPLGQRLFEHTTRNVPATPGPRPGGRSLRAPGDSAHEGQLASQRALQL